MSAVWIAVIAISLLGLIFGLILGYASRRFAVQDDPVVEKIDELLPQSQCGQCGYPGCRPYAEAVGVQGEKINRCAPPCGTSTRSLSTAMHRKRSRPACSR